MSGDEITGGERTGSLLCDCCLSIFKIIFSLGVVILIWWLTFHPHDIKLYITSAELFTFNSTTAFADNSSAPLLQYNVTFGLSLRNPNRRIGVYYDLIEATAFSGGSLLQTTELPPFFQHTKNTTLLRPTFGGQATAVEYQLMEQQGSLGLKVKLHARVRFKVWFVKVGHLKRDFDCSMARISDSVASPDGIKCDH